MIFGYFFLIIGVIMLVIKFDQGRKPSINIYGMTSFFKKAFKYPFNALAVISECVS
jgi:hypothetical protein